LDWKLWRRENCKREFSVEPISDHAKGRDMGRRFRFTDQADATLLRLSRS